MTLDLASSKRALASLERAITRSIAAPKDEELRDAVIQRFEYSYELSWKMLKRHLEQVVPDPGAADQWSFRDLMREGAERGLIAAVEPWIEYRYQRKMTAHAYDEQKAIRVHESARSFIVDARALLAEVEPRLLHEVRTILKEHVPECEVWAFGSRIGAGSKRFSDLDLAVVATTPLSTRRLALLASAFEESDLPIKVDVVDWQSTPPAFQRRIVEHHEVVFRPIEPQPSASPESGS